MLDYYGQIVQKVLSNEEIGEKIRELREAKSLTVNDLAEASGKGTGLIYRWERGEREPGLVELQKLAHRIGVKIAFIFGEAENDLPTPRQALEVLTGLVETAEAQERLLAQFRSVVVELAGEDPENWSDAVKAVMGGGTHPSPHSARSGEEKSYDIAGDGRYHDRRERKEKEGQDETGDPG